MSDDRDAGVRPARSGARHGCAEPAAASGADKAARPLCQQTVNLAWAAIVPTAAASQPASDLFDNLVGKDKNSLWQHQAQHFSGPEINNKYKSTGLLDRKISCTRALENLIDITRGFAA